jgi:hypothetical protein
MRRPQNFSGKRAVRLPDAIKPTLFKGGLTLTPLTRGEFDGRIIFNGFATAKNLVIGY